MVSDELLRRDVRMLGDMLGAVITQLAGGPAFELVEQIRVASRERRAGAAEAERQLAQLIGKLDEPTARTVARAFSIFFDLANIAEDRQRVRVLREREADRDPQPLPESVAAGIVELKEKGYTPERVQSALDALSVDLVFTAHPSEAKRRSIRAKLRRMRQALEDYDRPDLLPRERRGLEERLHSELSVLWQTEFLRPQRPTVLEEVERGLSIMPRLWDVMPRVYQALRRGLSEAYPEHNFRLPVFLRFGSWMGGDRDGNPNVTAEVTAQTLCRLRNAAIDRHLGWCKQLHDYLTISLDFDSPAAELLRRVEAAKSRWPELSATLAAVAPREAYRQWIKVIEWRLKQSRATDLNSPAARGNYDDPGEFHDDVQALVETLSANRAGGEALADDVVQRWVDLAHAFGLHLTRLDVRQDSRRYSEVLTDIFRTLGLAEDFASLDELAKQRLLTESLAAPPEVPAEKLAPLTQDTLELYRVLQRAMARFGADCLGGNVISLTQAASDMLGVLWLWRWAQADAARRGHPPADGDLKIVPLFEKIDDLENAPQTLSAILAVPAYAEHLGRQERRQIIMVGYSDSTKDGGYLAACWGLYRAQAALERVAADLDVRVTFFHGRGGSLGRGGGPAARGILSLPPGSLDGSLRLTEQGEVLAERYDDVQIAYRHLEQVTWATLVGSTVRRAEPKPAWVTLSERMSQRSLVSYRQLVDQPGFIQFFGETTPIDEIENLPIGSRPSRRRGERSLNDLRAIPWVFSWTQNRCLIPAWYGLGTALDELRAGDDRDWALVGEMYREWAFFQAAIDNAALALVKADTYVAACYASLAESPEIRTNLWTRIADEFDRTRQLVQSIVGGKQLLASAPWLEHSVEVRNPYIDPLNLIQIEFMRRRRAKPADEWDPAEAESLRNLLRLTVQGIAAGMRTTG